MSSRAPEAGAEPTPAWLDERIDGLTFQPRGAHKAPQALRVQRVVVALERSPEGQHVLAWARELVPLFDPSFLLLHAEPVPGGLAYSDARDAPPELDEAGRVLLDEAAELLREAGARVDARMRQPQAAPEGIRRLVQEERGDLVVTGAAPRTGVERFLLGSVAEGIKNHVDAAVLFARTPPLPGDVLCPVDGSPASRRAAALAHRLARAWGSQLFVLHVVEPPERGPVGDEASHLVGLRNRLRLPWNDVPGVRFDIDVGDPRTVLEHRVQADRPALVVMGSRGLGGLRSLFLGSVSSHLSHRASSSVLVVREP